MARLASSILAGALLRRAESEGGFGVVLGKGDETSGAILIILLERGGNPRILERVLQPDATYEWREIEGQTPENREKMADFLARRRRFDPDLWVLELDVPSQERFAAEMNSFR